MLVRIRRGMLVLVMVTGALAMVSNTPAAGQVTGADALQSRARTELAVFTDWLQANGVQGYIGEVGWPNNTDTAAWNSLAQAWYQDAAAANLWVAGWSTGEWWGTTYKLSSYVWGGQGGTLAVTKPPATVIEAQSSTTRRGVNVNGADFGPIGIGLNPTSTLSNANPGVYDQHWHYDKQQSFTYLAARGITTVRLAFRWERLQPTLGGPLDPTELSRLVAAVGRARAAGLQVVLNPQNYGAYWMSDGTQGVRRAIGSAEVPTAQFADLWRRVSVQFAADPGVIAYGLMNEPVGMSGPTAWQQASQSALSAIRATGDTKLVMVPGYQWSGVSKWTTQHPQAWIVDPAANFRYEAHQYFDRDASGNYGYTYAQELADAQARGFTGSGSPSTTVAPVTTTTAPVATTTTTAPVATTTTTAPVATTTTTVPVATTTTVPTGVDTVAPTAPTNLTANGARKKALLSWTASTDSGGSGLAGYEVWRATAPSGPFVRVTTTVGPSFADSPVTPRVSYWYYVVAYDGRGNRSMASTTVSVIPN